MGVHLSITIKVKQTIPVIFFQMVQEFTSKLLGQYLNWNKEIFAAAAPLIAFGQPAGQHHGMDMRVVVQILPPSMQDRKKSGNDLQLKKESIINIAETYGASNVRIFDSVVRGEDNDNSDIDFLVEFSPGRSLFDLINVKLELEDLLGRSVDVVTEKSLHPLIRDSVIEAAVEL